MTPVFRSTLEFEDDGGFPFQLLQALVFDSAVLNRTITVPAGFLTDLASIPRPLWNVLPPIGKYDEAAVVNDLLYQQAPDGCTRAQADAVLREAMEVCGVNAVQRWLIYQGVRTGGWVVWRRYRDAEPSKEAA